MTLIAGLPGMRHLATKMMKEMAKLDLPTVRELIDPLDDAGVELYGCRLAMDVLKLTRGDLVPQMKDVITASGFFEKSASSQIIFIWEVSPWVRSKR